MGRAMGQLPWAKKFLGGQNFSSATEPSGVVEHTVCEKAYESRVPSSDCSCLTHSCFPLWAGSRGDYGVWQ